MSCNKTFNHLSVRGMIWILTKSPRMVHLPYLIGMVNVCLLRRMRFILSLQILRSVNMRMRFILNPLFLNTISVHAQDSTPWGDSESDSPHAQGPIPLRERGRDTSPRQTNNEGLRIRRSERGRILRRYFQIEQEIFLCTPLEVDEPTSY